MARPRLIRPISLVGLVVAISVVFVLLFPKNRVADLVQSDSEVDEFSLQYLRYLLATEEDNIPLRIKLAKDYARIGRFELALKTLEPLLASMQPERRNAAALARLEILLKLAFSAPSGGPAREEKLKLFRRELRVAEKLMRSDSEIRQLAKLAMAGGEIKLAESLLENIALGSNNLGDLEEAARLALANGEYLKSARFIWRARDIASDPEQKFSYMKLALSTLQSGGMGEVGLEWVQQLPAAEWHRRSVLYVLIKLALASNKPALAAELSSKLVVVDRPFAEQPHFIQPHLDIAYTAFLGNGDSSSAMKLALIAVDQSPGSVMWHERLAHVAEWSGQPKVAIGAWRWLALNRGLESDWKDWMRLADALFDYEAQIAGLEYEWKRHDKDEKYVRKIVRLYEDLGRPEAALAWLDGNIDESREPGLLLLSAELSGRIGNDEDALARYRRYLKRNSASPDLAVTIAGMMQRIGLYEEAFGVLAHSEQQANPAHKLFWGNYGELAWMLKKNDAAIVAYRTLSDEPDAEKAHQLRLFQLLKMKDSKLAAQTAEKYWIKNGGIELFMSAAETYVELNDWQAVQHLYRLAVPPKSNGYDSSLRYISLRAEMNERMGNRTAAIRDFRILVARNPGNLAIKEAYLWMLIEAGSYVQLEVVMQQWEKLLPGAPGLREPFAAGYLALGRPGKAIVLYDRMAESHTQDELWLLNYAATLEMDGQIKRAAQIRKQIWQQNLSKKSRGAWLASGAGAKDVEALRLLLLNDPRLGQTVLWKLLRDGSPELKQNTQFVELASLWLNEHDQNDAGRAWLIRQYARRLSGIR